MWELDHKGGRALKNWYFWIVMLEKTLKSLLDGKEIKPVNPKGNQPWIFIGRTDAEAPILWPPDARSWLIGKDPDAGKDWKQKEKRGGRGWDGKIAPPAQWTWIWSRSRRQRRTGVPPSMGSKESDMLATEEQQERQQVIQETYRREKIWGGTSEHKRKSFTCLIPN